MSYLRRRYHKPGTEPGTFDVERTRVAAEPDITVTDYSAQQIEVTHGAAALESPQRLAVRWISIAGQPSLDILQRLQEKFRLEPLALEDVVNTGQRPKFSGFSSGPFITLAMPRADGDARFCQLSVFVTPGVVVSFIDHSGQLLAPIHDRLQVAESRIRASNELYLMYCLADLAIDLLFPTLVEIGEELEVLEESILGGVGDSALADTHALRNHLLVMRKVSWATRELLSDLLRHLDMDEHAAVRPYVQDAYDHVVSAIDLVETYREMSTGLVELYLSVTNNRMTDVMRVLTVIATVFIPPTFVVGVYGMNFDRHAGPLSMPELGWPLGYVGVMGLSLLMMLGMLLYFKRKGWF